MSPVKHYVLRRLAALLTLSCFFLTQLMAPAFSASGSDPAVSTSPSAAFPEDLSTLKIPANIGKLEEVFQGKDNRLVILLQDAHSIPNAQRNIRNLIDFFQQTHGLEAIAVEGARGKLDPQIFRSFPDRELLKGVFSEYLERGELTGTTLAAVFNKKIADYQEIEDWKLYEEGYGYYLSALQKQDEISQLLLRETENLQLQKNQNYSPDLLRVDTALNGFRTHEVNLLEVLKTLAAVKAPPAGSELALMLEESAKTDESRIPLEIEVKSIAEKMKKYFLAHPAGVKAGTVSEFNEKYQAFQTSLITAEQFAVFLKDAALDLGLPVVFSGDFQNRVKKQKKIEDIEGTRFFDQFEHYAESVKAGLFRGPEDRALDEESRRLYLLERLRNLEVTRDQWHQLKSYARRGAFEGPNNIFLDQSDLERLLPEEDLRSLFVPHLLFYENSETRDEVFTKNLEAILQKQGARKAVMLVAGGFHTEGVVSRLREEGISYVLLMPQIESLPETVYYQEHMKGNVSWKDYFQPEGGDVNVYKAFVRATRDRLQMSAANQNDRMNKGALLKDWRDQVIRDLSKEGRISDSAQYTRFMDEAVDKSGQKPGVSELLEKADLFVAGLKELRGKGQLTEANILGLLRPATMAPEIPTNALVNQPIHLAEASAPEARSELRSLNEKNAPLLSRRAFLTKAAVALTAAAAAGTAAYKIFFSKTVNSEQQRILNEAFEILKSHDATRAFLDKLGSDKLEFSFSVEDLTHDAEVSGNKIVINRRYFESTKDPKDYAALILHEGTHYIREKEGRWAQNDLLTEEIETRQETVDGFKAIFGETAEEVLNLDFEIQQALKARNAGLRNALMPLLITDSPALAANIPQRVGMGDLYFLLRQFVTQEVQGGRAYPIILSAVSAEVGTEKGIRITYRPEDAGGNAAVIMGLNGRVLFRQGEGKKLSQAEQMRGLGRSLARVAAQPGLPASVRSELRQVAALLEDFQAAETEGRISLVEGEEDLELLVGDVRVQFRQGQEKGGFGTVRLTRPDSDGNVYAVKFVDWAPSFVFREEAANDTAPVNADATVVHVPEKFGEAPDRHSEMAFRMLKRAEAVMSYLHNDENESKSFAVPKLVGSGAFQNGYYIVMKNPAGQDLDSARKELSLQDRLEVYKAWGEENFRLLREAGIAPQDIKSANFLLNGKREDGSYGFTLIDNDGYLPLDERELIPYLTNLSSDHPLKTAFGDGWFDGFFVQSAPTGFNELSAHERGYPEFNKFMGVALTARETGVPESRVIAIRELIYGFSTFYQYLKNIYPFVFFDETRQTVSGRPWNYSGGNSELYADDFFEGLSISESERVGQILSEIKALENFDLVYSESEDFEKKARDYVAGRFRQLKEKIEELQRLAEKTTGEEKVAAAPLSFGEDTFVPQAAQVDTGVVNATMSFARSELRSENKAAQPSVQAKATQGATFFADKTVREVLQDAKKNLTNYRAMLGFSAILVTTLFLMPALGYSLAALFIVMMPVHEFGHYAFAKYFYEKRFGKAGTDQKIEDNRPGLALVGRWVRGVIPQPSIIFEENQYKSREQAVISIAGFGAELIVGGAALAAIYFLQPAGWIAALLGAVITLAFVLTPIRLVLEAFSPNGDTSKFIKALKGQLPSVDSPASSPPAAAPQSLTENPDTSEGSSENRSELRTETLRTAFQNEEDKFFPQLFGYLEKAIDRSQAGEDENLVTLGFIKEALEMAHREIPEFRQFSLHHSDVLYDFADYLVKKQRRLDPKLDFQLKQIDSIVHDIASSEGNKEAALAKLAELTSNAEFQIVNVVIHRLARLLENSNAETAGRVEIFLESYLNGRIQELGPFVADFASYLITKHLEKGDSLVFLGRGTEQVQQTLEGFLGNRLDTYRPQIVELLASSEIIKNSTSEQLLEYLKKSNIPRDGKVVFVDTGFYASVAKPLVTLMRKQSADAEFCMFCYIKPSPGLIQKIRNLTSYFFPQAQPLGQGFLEASDKYEGNRAAVQATHFFDDLLGKRYETVSQILDGKPVTTPTRTPKFYAITNRVMTRWIENQIALQAQAVPETRSELRAGLSDELPAAPEKETFFEALKRSPLLGPLFETSTMETTSENTFTIHVDGKARADLVVAVEPEDRNVSNLTLKNGHIFWDRGTDRPLNSRLLELELLRVSLDYLKSLGYQTAQFVFQFGRGAEFLTVEFPDYLAENNPGLDFDRYRVSAVDSDFTLNLREINFAYPQQFAALSEQAAKENVPSETLKEEEQPRSELRDLTAGSEQLQKLAESAGLNWVRFYRDSKGLNLDLGQSVAAVVMQGASADFEAFLQAFSEAVQNSLGENSQNYIQQITAAMSDIAGALKTRYPDKRGTFVLSPSADRQKLDRAATLSIKDALARAEPFINAIYYHGFLDNEILQNALKAGSAHIQPVSSLSRIRPVDDVPFLPLLTEDSQRREASSMTPFMQIGILYPETYERTDASQYEETFAVFMQFVFGYVAQNELKAEQLEFLNQLQAAGETLKNQGRAVTPEAVLSAYADSSGRQRAELLRELNEIKAALIRPLGEILEEAPQLLGGLELGSPAILVGEIANFIQAYQQVKRSA